MASLNAHTAQMRAPKKKRPSRRSKREAITFYLTVAPWFIGFIAFIMGPMIYSMFISFTKWDMLVDPIWIGIDNYVRMFTKDPDFYRSLKVTSIYTVASVPLRLIVALFLAVLLNEGTKAVGLFRTSFYLPAVVASVAAAILWQWLLNPKFGPINNFIELFGIDGPSWFNDPKWALWGLVLMSGWNVGGEMLIFLAGLKGIPQHLYEAAEIDGAGRVSRFFNITIPMLSSAIFFNFVMSVIGSFQTFDAAFVISTARAGDIGSPLKSTLFYLLHLYQQGFEFLNMGYATALAWVLFVIILVLTLIILRSSALWVYYEAERGE
jgi:multiple sugar transport system permease protein